MTDLIFWWTGWVVWAILSLVLFVACLVSIGIVSMRLYLGGQSWDTLRRLAKVPEVDSAEYWSLLHSMEIADRESGLDTTPVQREKWLECFKRECADVRNSKAWF